VRSGAQWRPVRCRAHVAAGPETGIITDEQQTKAAGQGNSDPALAEEFLAREGAGDDTDARAPPGRPARMPRAAGTAKTPAQRRTRIAQVATWRGRRLKLRYRGQPGTTPGSSAAPPP
jgi:hypothetical protein